MFKTQATNIVKSKGFYSAERLLKFSNPWRRKSHDAEDIFRKVTT